MYGERLQEVMHWAWPLLPAFSDSETEGSVQFGKKSVGGGGGVGKLAPRLRALSCIRVAVCEDGSLHRALRTVSTRGQAATGLFFLVHL